MKTYAFVSLLVALPLAVACSASSDEASADDAELEEAPGALTSSDIDCSKTTMTAYQGGSRIADVEVIKVGGKNITMKTAHAFLYLQKKAAEKGSNIWINSGFR